MQVNPAATQPVATRHVLRRLLARCALAALNAARVVSNDGMSMAGVVYLAALVAERSGALPRAIALYARALEMADRSDRRSVFKSRQRWQFHLERARYRAGRAQVDDPLFHCRTGTTARPGHEASGPGHYACQWMFRGLQVVGFLAPGSPVREVRLRVDGQLLKGIGVARELGVLPYFQYTIQRAALARLPRSAILRIETPDGEALVDVHGGDARLSIPHGVATVAGWQAPRVDKKGFLIPPGDALPARQQAFLRTYEAVARHFDAVGVPLFLLYGTLLGQHRGGDFIPGDDDFDVGYLGDAGSPVEARAEAMRLAEGLVEAGFVVSFNRSGRLLRVRLPGSRPEEHLDVHGIWIEQGQAWIHPQARLACARGDFLPVREAQLRGTRVLVPALPERFLEAYYGADWRTPNPAYSTAANDNSRLIVRHLAKSLVGPREYRAMRERLAASRTRRPGGQLVSMGSHDLYPLEDFFANCEQ